MYGVRMHNALFGLNLNEYRAPRILYQRYFEVYPYPGYCARLTDVTEVPGKGMGILQNLQKFRNGYGSVTELTEVPDMVARAYRSHRSSGQV